jgi:hypothetical protein
MQLRDILTRAGRALYWVGLLAGPFVGAALITASVFVALRTLRVGRGLLPAIVIGVGLLSWMGLIRAYRSVIPIPCSKCGRAASASSLNPVTVRCVSCGYVEELDIRILGA